MKRILMVSCGGLGHGGTSAVIFSIVNSLYTEFDFECLVYRDEQDREKEFLQYGKLIRTKCCTGKKSLADAIANPFRLFKTVFFACKKEHYDAIHCHNGNDEWVCLLAAKMAGVKNRIAHSHNTKSPQKKSIVKHIYEAVNAKLTSVLATQRIGCSEQACKDFYKTDNYQVIYNAIDLSKFNTLSRTEDEYDRFIHVGRFSYQKNQEFVIDTFSEILKGRPNAHLNLIGYGEDEEKLINLIKEKKIEKNVDLLPGNKVNIPEQYANADYMIFPSRFEGFGIVLIEAQASGVVCFASEAVQDDVNLGLFYKFNLADGPTFWANEIINLMNQKSEINSDHLLNFSLTKISRQYADVYNRQ